MDALHAAVAIILAIVLIIRFKVDPVISLIVSSLYLGLAAGVGLTETVEAITGGFGDIMAEVGLLIGFGVLIGSLLQATGTFADVVALIARRVGRRLPYAMSAALAMIFPSIYVDVQVVLASPMARQAAPVVDRRHGLPWLAGAIGIGIFSGYVFVVPGLAAISVVGLLDVSLGRYLVLGAPIGLATALITTLLFRLMLKAGLWNAAKDVDPDEVEHPDHARHEAHLAAGEARAAGTSGGASGAASTDPDEEVDAVPERARRLPLIVRLAPILVPLVLIATGAFTDLAGDVPAVIAFLGDANIALFIGLLIAFGLCRGTLGTDSTGDALSSGFRTTGEILLITGIGGSLGAVIGATGLETTLADLFTATPGTAVAVTVLLAWAIAAVLHFAIGSVSVGAIAAAGVIAPVVGSTGVDPVVVGLAIASGAMFALHVNSNFFWMFKSLLGLSTQGALKTLTLATSLGALVSLPMVLVLGFVV
ncbi:GntP family permease [Aeromicrobium sp. CF4.19]|uniref:GntP family permease n=1 Tax=Aeromicrobium sp. CF4.19 TaxID=3373082 RepID=UPI003EE53BD0